MNVRRVCVPWASSLSSFTCARKWYHGLMQSKAKTVAEYLASLPADRKAAVGAVRDVILKNLGKGFKEGMSYGMIGYCVPHSIYPAGYHCDPSMPLPFAGLASQKQHISVYLMSVYADQAEEKWLRDQWKKAGKKLDMGKCCIRFRKLEDVPLAALGEAVRRVSVERHIEYYETAMKGAGRRAAAGGKAKGKTTKRAATKPSPRKKVVKKATRRA